MINCLGLRMLLSACPVLMIKIRERISQIDPRSSTHSECKSAICKKMTRSFIQPFISWADSPTLRLSPRSRTHLHAQSSSGEWTRQRAPKKEWNTHSASASPVFYESVCVRRTHCIRASVLSRKALGIMQILTVYAPRREPNERDH